MATVKEFTRPYHVHQFHSTSGKSRDDGKWVVWRKLASLDGLQPTIGGRVVDMGNRGSTMSSGVTEFDTERHAVAVSEFLNLSAQE